MATNSSETEYYPVSAGLALCKTLFGFLPDATDFQDVVRLVLSQTRGLQIRPRIGLNVPVVNGFVEAPCNAQIKAVTQSVGYKVSAIPPSALLGTNDEHPSYVLRGTPASNYISSEDLALLNQPGSGYRRGAYVDFNFIDGQLEIQGGSSHVDILYDEIMVSPEGDYLVPLKVVTAIAYFLNHIKVQQDYFMGKVGREMTELAEKRYGDKCAQARTGVLSDNTMNKLLNIMVSADRHTYNKPANNMYNF